MSVAVDNRHHSRFPTSWPVEPFSQVVFDVTGGNAKIKRGDYRDRGSLPVIDQGSEFIGGYVDDNELACKVKLPCVLFGDHTRIFKYVDKPFALGADGVKVLTTRDDLDTRFAYHYLRQVRLPEDAGYSRHFKFLKEFDVPLPPLEEQKRIAAILDKADAIRRKRAEALRLTDDFLKSVFLDMFGDPVTNPKGWPEVELGNQLEFLTSGSRGWAQYYAETGDLFFRIQNVGRNALLLEDIAYINAPDSAEAKRTKVQPGDVLLSITADLGRTCVVPEGIGNAYINQHLALLRSKKIVPLYLSAYLASEGGQRQFRALNRNGVKAGLNFDDVRGLRILLPDRVSQVNYAKIYKRHGSARTNLCAGAKTGENLFSALVQRAFRGEL